MADDWHDVGAIAFLYVCNQCWMYRRDLELGS